MRIKPDNHLRRGLYRMPVHGAAVCALLAVMFASPRAHAVIDLKAGDPAPALAARSINGKSVQVPDPRGEIQILLFGDSAHDSLLKTAKQIDTSLKDPRADDLDVQWVMILGAGSKPEDVTMQLGAGILERLTIVVDKDRKAFDAYGVVALPSVATVNPEGVIVRTHAGPNPRAQQLFLEDLLVASKRLDPTALEQHDAKPGDHDHDRAARLIHLAEQLRSRGMLDNAESTYRKALEILPDDPNTNTALGEILLETGRAAEAIPMFQTALASDPDAPGASLGLAEAQLVQEAPNLDAVEKMLTNYQKTHPDNPRASYLLGRVLEARGDYENAAAAFKRCAELLMD